MRNSWSRNFLCTLPTLKGSVENTVLFKDFYKLKRIVFLQLVCRINYQEELPLLQT